MTNDDLPPPEGPYSKPTAKDRAGSVSSIRRFQARIDSGRPWRSRGPGTSVTKKSASSASKARSPFGTIRGGPRAMIRRLDGPAESTASPPTDGPMPASQFRRSSASSAAVSIAVVHPFRQALQADPLQLAGDRLVDLSGRLRAILEDRTEDLLTPP